MPKYNFKCSSCGFMQEQYLSMSAFKEIKNDGVKCECGETAMPSASIGNVKIDRKKEELLMEIKEEVSKIVEKIEKGDPETLRDVYGWD
jgi:DNA-directed RNA polymerase beta' subunit